MTAYGRTLAITGLALLVAVSGCRTTKEDRIRVLEAERAAEKREKERLQNELAATHSSQLAAQAEVEKQEATLRTLQEQLRLSHSGPVTAGQTIDVRSRLEASGVRVEGRGSGAAIILASDVTFKPGHSELSKQAMVTLDRVVIALKSIPGVQRIRVEGHTDSDPIRKSGWSSNEALSQARAENVRKYLVEKGLDRSMVTKIGYGSARPVFPNDTAANKASNRRVEIVVDAG
ncbi:MAG: OmpA family protein [Planctomycetota bacterium]|nr:OmpA family protein [Planctomycetota bacterium]